MAVLDSVTASLQTMATNLSAMSDALQAVGAYVHTLQGTQGSVVTPAEVAAVLQPLDAANTSIGSMTTFLQGLVPAST
jgi:hypothetical protein